MPIITGQHSAQANFTIVPNLYLRDKALSWRARGLLAYLMSMQPGWSMSIDQLTAAGMEGRNAVRSALWELEKAGYLVRQQTNENGRFGESIWKTQDPDQGSQKPLADKPLAKKPLAENQPTKNTIEEELIKENYKKTNQSDFENFADNGFEDFWDAYPRKVAKAKAREAYLKAIQKTTPEQLAKKARAYADEPGRDDAFTKHPATWLNAEGWDDYYAADRRETAEQKRLAELEATRRMIAETERPRQPLPKCQHGLLPARCKKCLRGLK